MEITAPHPDKTPSKLSDLAGEMGRCSELGFFFSVELDPPVAFIRFRACSALVCVVTLSIGWSWDVKWYRSWFDV